MRILLTADPELPVPPELYGGIERIIDVLLRGLQARGHQVGLVARQGSTAPADAFFPWPGLSSRNRNDTLRNIGALRRAVKEFRPDVLHSFSRLWYMAPLLPTKLPKIMSYQRDPSARTTRLAARLAGPSLTFTGCSENICRIGRNGGGRWVPIHNCVELETYDFAPTVEPDAPLAFLSRIEFIKGTHVAIEATRRAGRRLLIAGNHGTDGEMGRYWREEIEPHLGKDGIEYIGTVNDAQKNALLGKSAAMIVPIQWDEPFGIVFAEALACGTPVISSPRGSLPEIVEPGIHGFLVKSVEEAVEGISDLPRIDRAACRKRAVEHFSAAVIVGKYEALYREVAGVLS